MLQALEASGDMASVLKVAAGPDGRAVMVSGVISRSGGRILTLTFQPSDPVFALLLNSADELHNMLGDGVKNYIILFNALLTLVKFNNVTLLSKLQILESRLQLCFATSNCDCVLYENSLQNVIHTFFSTRFTSVVAMALSKLVHEWVSKLRSIKEVCTYLYDFDVLCIKFFPFPLFTSSIQNGLLLKGIQPRRLPQNVNVCHMIVHYHPAETIPDDGEIESEILNLVIRVKLQNVNTLFVTNLFVQERVLFLLNCKNLFVVHSVSIDVVKFLFDKCIFNIGSIVKCRYVNDFLWVSLKNVSQLILKAPNTAIATEYSVSVKDCLKMLSFSFKEISCTVPAGGHFEQVLARQLFFLISSIRPRLPPVKCREQLFSWKTDISSDSDMLKHIDLNKLKDVDTEVVDLLCRALLPTALPHRCPPDIVEPLVVKTTVITKALNTLISILRLDCTYSLPKKGRLV